MLKLTDLPEEAQEKLKPLSRLGFELLEIDARRIRHEEAEAEFPTEAQEAMRAANKRLIADVDLKVPSPREFVESAFELALLALNSKDFTCDDTEHLAHVLSVARDVNAANNGIVEEASARLRAAFKK